MMFMPNSPSPPSGTTCNFRSDIRFEWWIRRPFERRSESVLLMEADGAEWKGARKAGTHSGRSAVAGWMAVAAGTHLLAGAPVDKEVIDHVVSPAGHSAGDVVVDQHIAHLPGDDVICAGGVAADAESSYQLLAGLLVEGQPATEDVDSADLLADQRVARLAVFGRGSRICDRGVDRVAELQTVERAAVLRSGIQVRGGKGEAWNAEGIRRVGFLG